MELSYDASGHKPEQHHGWVGLGWNLNVGGIITRIKKSLVDEYKSPATGAVNKGYFDSYTKYILQAVIPLLNINHMIIRI